MSFISENQIYVDFKSFVETALNEFDIENWEVKQLYQTIKTEDLKPCVYITIIDNSNYGAEKRKNTKNNSKYYKNYSRYQIVKIRFQATRRKQIKDDTDTLNGIDVLKRINGYLQSLNGIKLLDKNGYSQFKGSGVQNQSFSNDDENIQLMPYFDCEFVYTDEFNLKLNIINKVIEKEQKGL